MRRFQASKQGLNGGALAFSLSAMKKKYAAKPDRLFALSACSRALAAFCCSRRAGRVQASARRTMICAARNRARFPPELSRGQYRSWLAIQWSTEERARDRRRRGRGF